MSHLAVAESQRFRRSSHLAGYWGPGGLRIRNFARHSEQLVFGRACEVLGAFSDWRTPVEAQRYCPGIPLDELERAVRDLHRDGFLIGDRDDPDPAAAAMDALSAWNPAAGFFHSATRNCRFSDLDELRRDQRTRALENPWPGALHVPETTDVVSLEQPDTTSALAKTLKERRSWRQFGDGPLPLDALASLLWLTGGVQRWVVTELGTFALKTSPSGGSLHPIELYVLARTVDGLDAGVYHYGCADHRLRRITAHATPPAITTYLPAQPWFEGAGAVVFLVAHFERSLWRYTYPRAYRAPLVEAGHLAQTFCLHATELGLAPFVTMALADDAIEREVQADGITRAVLYAAGVGLRPNGAEWAPVPVGAAIPVCEVNDPVKSRMREGDDAAV